MIRSSFLSRIKEIGVLRAIGVKKADIYRMFIGEIFAITTIAGMPGILLMTYILYNAAKVSYFEGMSSKIAEFFEKKLEIGGKSFEKL